MNEVPVLTACAEQEQMQRMVLLTVLDHHPDQLTIAELQRELLGTDPEFAESASFEQSLRELIGSGLLHQHGQLVCPTRAARCFADLAE